MPKRICQKVGGYVVDEKKIKEIFLDEVKQEIIREYKVIGPKDSWFSKKFPVRKNIKFRFLLEAFVVSVIFFSYALLLLLGLTPEDHVQINSLASVNSPMAFVPIVNIGKYSWMNGLLTGTVAIFVSYFAFKYTLFNNQWKYTADLYNKIYVDLSYSDNFLSLLRKRCLLAKDIMLQDLESHESFSLEFKQTVIIALFVNNLIEKNSELKTPLYIIDEKSRTIRTDLKIEDALSGCIIVCEGIEFKKSIDNENNADSNNSNIQSFVQSRQSKIYEEIDSITKSHEEICRLISTIDEANLNDATSKTIKKIKELVEAA